MRKFVLIFVTVLAVVVSGCGTAEPATSTFIPGDQASFATAMVATADGGLQYGDSRTGNFYKADKNGQGDGGPIAHVDLNTNTVGDITGMTTDGTDKTFAAWVDKNNRITVGQISPGPMRILWQGPPAKGTEVVGRLTYSPYGRIIVALGNIDSAAYNGALISLDPDGLPGQSPNVISKNWNDPYGIAYSTGGALWVADNNHMARAAENGATGQDTKFAKSDMPRSMTVYGDQELVVCFGGNHKLKRYLLSDGVQALPGRVLANDCEYSVIQLKDGRLAYSTKSEIRVTAL